MQCPAPHTPLLDPATLWGVQLLNAPVYPLYNTHVHVLTRACTHSHTPCNTWVLHPRHIYICVPQSHSHTRIPPPLPGPSSLSLTCAHTRARTYTHTRQPGKHSCNCP